MSLVSFIIPLLPRARSQDWDRDCRHLGATLRSILNQDCGDFRIFVVAHEEPDLYKLSDNRLELVLTNEPVNQNSSGQRQYDKLHKTHRGLLAAAEQSSEYVMVCDADDLIHRQVVRLTGERRPNHGFVIRHGFGYHARSRRLYAINTLNNLCNTAHILRLSSIGAPDSMDRAEEQKCIPLHVGHGAIAGVMARHDRTLDEFPHRGVVYTVAHGGNNSARYAAGYSARASKLWLRSLMSFRPLTSAVRRDFAFLPQDYER